jgi:hypothetical protein
LVLVDHEDHGLKEDECLREIQEIRARDKDGTGFQSYIQNLDPHFVLLRHLQDDIRPGSQREKDYRWVLDVSLYLPSSLYITPDNFRSLLSLCAQRNTARSND